jgi:hypothetical protein
VRKRNILITACCFLLSVVLLINCTKKQDNTPVYPTDCGNNLVGTYSGSDYCSSAGQTPYQCSITANTPVNITISNMGGFAVNAILTCNDNTVSVPTQTFAGNFSISGTGTFTANRIIINWSGISFGVPINCTSTYTR